jgi:hypothetical protein
MKSFCVITVIVVFLLLRINGLQAQTPQVKLNQVELLKQFIGTWKCDAAKDTTSLYKIEPYGTGFITNSKIITKGNTIGEWTHIYEYINGIDKYIIESKNQDINAFAAWFISNNKMLIIPYSDISNPEKASWKTTDEYVSPDKLVETTLVNNKFVKMLTFTRVK